MQEALIYGFSRAIYRELAPDIVEDGPGSELANHARVLQACEATMTRLAVDRRYFGRPVRSLFREIRVHFRIDSQLRVLRVIEHFLGLAEQYLERLPKHGFDADGNPLRCQASTRKGTPCRRPPLLSNGYCPSHQRLAETEDYPARRAA
jgi:hypothetical protein